jgi:hypothetical protein
MLGAPAGRLPHRLVPLLEAGGKEQGRVTGLRVHPRLRCRVSPQRDGELSRDQEGHHPRPRWSATNHVGVRRSEGVASLLLLPLAKNPALPQPSQASDPPPIPNEDNPEELTYGFAFRESAEPWGKTPQHWYLAGRILDFEDAEDAKADIKPSLAGLTEEQRDNANKLVGRLHSRVHTTLVGNYYQEKSQDYSEPWRLFVRHVLEGSRRHSPSRHSHLVRLRDLEECVRRVIGHDTNPASRGHGFG